MSISNNKLLRFANPKLHWNLMITLNIVTRSFWVIGSHIPFKASIFKKCECCCASCRFKSRVWRRERFKVYGIVISKDLIVFMSVVLFFQCNYYYAKEIRKKLIVRREKGLENDSVDKFCLRASVPLSLDGLLLMRRYGVMAVWRTKSSFMAGRDISHLVVC